MAMNPQAMCRAIQDKFESITDNTDWKNGERPHKSAYIFYEVLKRDFPALEREIEISLHSRKQHRQARVIYENPDMFDRVKRAWAVWMLANGPFGCMLNGGFGYDRTGTTSKKLHNKRAGFTTDYAIRLQEVQIECCDALRIIGSRDTLETFFYLDPPYVGSDQGHYDGYTQMDFNESLTEFTGRNGWHTVEVLTTNYPVGAGDRLLF